MDKESLKKVSGCAKPAKKSIDKNPPIFTEAPTKRTTDRLGDFSASKGLGAEKIPRIAPRPSGNVSFVVDHPLNASDAENDVFTELCIFFRWRILMSTLGNVEFAEYRVGSRRGVSGSLCVEVWRRVDRTAYISPSRETRVSILTPQG